MFVPVTHKACQACCTCPCQMQCWPAPAGFHQQGPWACWLEREHAIAVEQAVCDCKMQAVHVLCAACTAMLPLQPSTPDVAINKTEAFHLHSRPTATKKIMLDFDGYTLTGKAWNAATGKAAIASPPYDKVCSRCVSTTCWCFARNSHMQHQQLTCTRKLFVSSSVLDTVIVAPTLSTATRGHHLAHICNCGCLLQDGSPITWSAAELADVLAIWRALSEDYAPWDVDVTTEDPGDAYLATNGVRAVIGGTYSLCEPARQSDC
jgi:hypothetical protein